MQGPRDRLRLGQQAEGLAAEAVADQRGPTAGNLRGREGQHAGEIGARPLQHRRGRPAERGRTRAADAAVVERHHREALVGEERREAAVVRAGHAGGRGDHRGAGRRRGPRGQTQLADSRTPSVAATSTKESRATRAASARQEEGRRRRLDAPRSDRAAAGGAQVLVQLALGQDEQQPLAHGLRLPAAPAEEDRRLELVELLGRSRRGRSMALI